jgi:hypothetical protein
MGLLTSRIAIFALLLLIGLVGRYIAAIVVGVYYPCSLPALTAYQARHQVGHLMRTAGINQKAFDLIAGLPRMGATAQRIHGLSDNCRDCIMNSASIGPFQSIWEASLIFPSLQTTRGHPEWVTQLVVLQIGSCQAVWIPSSVDRSVIARLAYPSRIKARA